MLRVGLTGGIGSGKTTVANYFAKLGVAVIDADTIAHELTAPGMPGYLLIVEHFGSEILTANQEIDRKKVRQLIFSQTRTKAWLENTLHPLILQAIRIQLKTVTSPYCIIVIPLLAETKLPIEFIDRVCVVDAPVHSRQHWAALRDKVPISDIAAIIANQSSSKKRLAIADDVISNTKDLATLAEQVKKLHHQYLQLATAQS